MVVGGKNKELFSFSQVFQKGDRECYYELKVMASN